MPDHYGVVYDDSVRGRLLDIFLPDEPNQCPLFALIHGGGWISGTRTDFHEMARIFASRGFAVACIGYRLAPLNPFPAAVDDVLSAIGFLRQAAPEYGYDPNRIVALGNSAGGHLACMTGLKDKLSTGEPAERANGVVSICAITDLRKPHESHFPVAFSFLDQFMQVSESEAPDVYAQASPIQYVTEDAPPFLIFHGCNDDIVPSDQSRKLFDSLVQAGVPAEIRLLEREGHSFLVSTWNEIMDEAAEFARTL